MKIFNPRFVSARIHKLNRRKKLRRNGVKMIKEIKRHPLGFLVSLAVLAAVVCVTCTPFVMMILGSFKEDYEIFSLKPRLLPQNGFQGKMYELLFANWPFWRNLGNSFIVAGITTALACFFCTLAGYTFAKYNFPLKNILFLIMLSSMMIPLETRLVPTYLLVRKLGGVNRLWSMIIPNAVPAFGIFMMRQFASGAVTKQTMEAARIEGASEGQIIMKVGFPMLKPAIVSLGILTFMNTWNEFLWPIIITTKKEKLTVTALLRSIGDVSMNGNYGVLLAAATLSALPIMVIYLIFHNQMINGILEGSGKE